MKTEEFLWQSSLDLGSQDWDRRKQGRETGIQNASSCGYCQCRGIKTEEIMRKVCDIKYLGLGSLTQRHKWNSWSFYFTISSGSNQIKKVTKLVKMSRFTLKLAVPLMVCFSLISLSLKSSSGPPKLFSSWISHFNHRSQAVLFRKSFFFFFFYNFVHSTQQPACCLADLSSTNDSLSTDDPFTGERREGPAKRC